MLINDWSSDVCSSDLQVLVSTGAATVSKVQLSASTILGRGSVGAAAALTMAELKTLLALVKGDVGLGNVDNTSDANKPVSSAQQTALDLKINKSILTADRKSTRQNSSH